MHPSSVPPRQVTIGEAASLAGTTPPVIRRYHEIGLLPEPERGSDDRRYGYDDMIRLLWIRRMVDAGIAVNDIPDALAGTAPAGAEDHHDLVSIRMGLLSDVVSSRLKGLPEGSLRPTDLDTLLVFERFFSPLGAAIHASRFIALATHPSLREESDRVDTAEEALDDTVALDDPLVAQMAAERHAFELALHTVIEESGISKDEEALVDSWDALHPAAAEEGDDEAGQGAVEQEAVSVIDDIGMMPYDFSPARLRCMELAEEISARESPAS